MNDKSSDKFYIISSNDPEQMLLYSMPDLPDDMEDSWLSGQPFTVEPEQPIHVEIQEGYESKKLMSFFDEPPVVSKAFLDTLIEAGVDNIMPYDVVLLSEDESIVHKGFKAINIIGLVKAAGPGTVYLGDSKLIDASIDSLELEARSIKDLLMFRLAEDVSAVVIHDKIKKHLEAKGFNDLVFTDPGDYLSL